MLAELLELTQSLKQGGFELGERHPHVFQPAKAEGYRVGLNEQGIPTAIEEISKEEMGTLWTFSDKGNKGRFPISRLQVALLPATDALKRERLAKVKTDQERLAVLQEAYSEFPVRATDEFPALCEKAKEMLAFVGDATPRYAALPAMLQRYRKIVEQPGAFEQTLVKLLLERIQEGRLKNLTLATALLVGKADKQKPNEPPVAGVLLAFDVAEETFPLHVADARMIPYISECLFKRDSDAEQKQLEALERATNVEGSKKGIRSSLRVGQCALTGEKTSLQIDPFPNPSLPMIGPMALFSKYGGMPHLRRYQMIENDAVAVGIQTAREIFNALKTITSDEHRGKIWRYVANGKFKTTQRNGKSVTTEEKDLLLVYVMDKPDLPLHLAAFFTDDEEVNTATRKVFEESAEAICEALSAHVKTKPDSRISLFLLRKVDKGNSQVTLSDTFLAQELIDAAQRWRQGGNYLPPITLNLSLAKGQKPEPQTPLLPSPEKVVRILGDVWFSRGTRCNAVQGVGLRQVLDVMLQKPATWRETAQMMLSMIIARTLPLWEGVWGTLRSDTGGGLTEHWKDYPTTVRVKALDAVGLMGLLLHLLNSERKENMQESAFLVGRILALADVLHKDYCVAVRDESLPPTLIGNGLFASALDDPSGALADLGERMRIYLGWAETASIPHGNDKTAERKQIAVREARKTLQRYEPLSQRLHELGLPTHEHMTAEMKAHLLLGYLASPKMDDND